MAWWKVALPVAIAGSGITAAVVAVVRSDDSVAASGTTVWIDAPADLAGVHPGVVTVTAHADAIDGPTSLTLSVDGTDVGTDDQLDIADGLALASFEWTAEEGVHQLVVTSADGGRSGTHTVFVQAEGDGATTTVPPTTTTTTPATTTTVAPTTTEAPTTVPPTTARPVTTPPTTAPPFTIPKPVIGKVTLTPGDCSVGFTVASVANATSASAELTSVPSKPPAVAVTPGAAPTTGFFPLNAAPDPYLVTVSVTATGPGGKSIAKATLTVSASKC